MANTIFNESYGTLTRPQQTAYRRFNVSPEDHSSLVDAYGANNHDSITAAVKAFSPDGMFSVFEMWRAK